MGMFIVEELGSGAKEKSESAGSLSAAKICAQRRASESQGPVVVRDGRTGEELARYEPNGGEGSPFNAVIAQLREVQKRLQRTRDRVGEDPNKKK
jgi:hypothetical protein